MSNFKLGLASVTFRNKSIEDVVSIAAKGGIDYIEWGADVHVKNEDEARKAKRLCDENNIRISSYGSYYTVGTNDRNEWERICRTACAMSASSVRVWLGKKNSQDTDENEYLNILADAKSMCETAQKYNLTVCPECHDHTYNNDTDAFLKIRQDIGKDNFRTYFQSRYFRMNYDLDRIDRTFDYIENVHVSYRDLNREQRTKKKDKNYIDTLIKKLKEKNFGGIIMIEFVTFSSEKSFLRDIDRLRKAERI